ncbi:MAG: hypothetical protein ABH871_02480 [Pseudomonadota bacterium]
MVVVSQTLLSSFLTDFQAFLLGAGVGLYPSRFDTTTTPYRIIYSTDEALVDGPLLHTSLHVRHFTHHLSPLKRLFYTNKAAGQSDAARAQSIRSGRKPFATVYLRLQRMMDTANAHLLKMGNPNEQVPREVEERLNKDKTAANLIHSAVLLSGLSQDKDSLEMAAKLFKASALLTINKDAKALLWELAYTAHCNTFAHIKPKDNAGKCLYWGRQLDYANATIDAWSDALLPYKMDAIGDPLRICAGVLASFSSYDNYERMIEFFQISQVLYRKHNMPEIAAADSLRMAWAKLAYAEAQDKEVKVDWEFVIQCIRSATPTLQNGSFHSVDVEELESFAKSAEMITQKMHAEH